MKSVLSFFLVFTLSAVECFGQEFRPQFIPVVPPVIFNDGSAYRPMQAAPITHQSGGCNSGAGQRQPNGGGRGPAPLIPPTTSPDLQPQASKPYVPPTVVIPAAPLIPVNPPQANPPQIAQTPVKECKCDQAQILALIEKLNERNDKLESLIIQVAQQKAQPGPAGPAGPAGAPAVAAKIDLDALSDQLAVKFAKNLRVSVEPLASK